VDATLKPLVAIPLLKITRYFSYSDEKIAKLYSSKYAKKKVETLLSGDWRTIMEAMYLRHAGEVVTKVNEYQKRKPHPIECIIKASDDKIFTEDSVIIDSIHGTLDGEVDVLVTSPPYIQAQEYIRSFKLELSWLGFSQEFITDLMKREIPYNNVGDGHIMSKTYEEIKKDVERLGHDKLKKLYVAYFNSLALFLNNNHSKIRKVIAIFVGPVKIRQMRIPIDAILKEHLEALGWKHEITLVDTIVARRLFKSRTNPATGLEDERTPTEHLLIMRKG